MILRQARPAPTGMGRAAAGRLQRAVRRLGARVVVLVALDGIALATALLLLQGLSAPGGWRAVLILLTLLVAWRAILRPIAAFATFPVLLILVPFTLTLHNAALVLLAVSTASLLGAEVEVARFASLLGAAVIFTISHALQEMARLSTPTVYPAGKIRRRYRALCRTRDRLRTEVERLRTASDIEYR
jgi:uncharacterized membrane protein YvlD (DUF360 family)